jgi:hypothetical protein
MIDGNSTLRPPSKRSPLADGMHSDQIPPATYKPVQETANFASKSIASRDSAFTAKTPSPLSGLLPAPANNAKVKPVNIMAAIVSPTASKACCGQEPDASSITSSIPVIVVPASASIVAKPTSISAGAPLSATAQCSLAAASATGTTANTTATAATATAATATATATATAAAAAAAAAAVTNEKTDESKAPELVAEMAQVVGSMSAESDAAAVESVPIGFILCIMCSQALPKANFSMNQQSKSKGKQPPCAKCKACVAVLA